MILNKEFHIRDHLEAVFEFDSGVALFDSLCVAPGLVFWRAIDKRKQQAEKDTQMIILRWIEKCWAFLTVSSGCQSCNR